MSMKLKRSTVEDVKARFELNKKKREEKQKEYSLKERLQDAKEEQERMAAYTSQVFLVNRIISVCYLRFILPVNFIIIPGAKRQA